MKLKKITFFFMVAAIVMIAASCRKENPDDTPQEQFDRQGMLDNYANNIIMPNYFRMTQTVDTLVILKNDFIANPNPTTLTSLQNGLISSWKNWMHCSMFEFGPASGVLLRQLTNTFPADTTQINSNIVSGTYTFGAAINIDAAGFPTLDYLLFGTGLNTTEIVDAYTINANATNRKQYLSDVVDFLETNIDQVYNDWISTGGNYVSTFINASGTDVGSGTGLLVNDLNYDFENLKNFRIGIPLGKQTLDIPLPEKVESLYGGFSSMLAREHIRAVENIYLGRSRSGNDGKGLDDYLNFVNAMYNSSSLDAVIKQRFADAIIALDNMPNDLADAVVNNSVPVDNAYQKLVQLLVLLKTDMPSSLGILITYQDNDGD